MGKFSPPSPEPPPPPPPPPPPAPKLADETVQRAGEDERRRARAARGYSSTRLTDALTNLQPAPTARKQLLGE